MKFLRLYRMYRSWGYGPVLAFKNATRKTRNA